MSLPTAAFSAHSQLRANILPYMAAAALATYNPGPRVSLDYSMLPLPSAFVPEAQLYQVHANKSTLRHVTNEESHILRLAILASSEVIDEGEFAEI